MGSDASGISNMTWADLHIGMESVAGGTRETLGQESTSLVDVVTLMLPLLLFDSTRLLNTRPPGEECVLFWG